jgi:GNAT superfamily N-acetyltransferase
MNAVERIGREVLVVDVAEASVVVVAPFVLADARAVAAHVLAIQRDELGVPITLGDQPDLADIPAFYVQRRGGFWVAKRGERVVGTLGLLDAGEEVALRKMFVDRAHRGAPYGIAQRLFDALLAHSCGHRIPRIHLGTRPEMRAAHRFYERNAFVRIEERALPPAFPRMAADSVFYRRDLTAGDYAAAER